MTALKPIENRRVRGVASERYPLNRKCAHPECNEDAVDPHHIFPRSAIGNDSWFVQFYYVPEGQSIVGVNEGDPIPHVAGLCRAHHDDVEEHRAWIKLEDGEYVWYDRSDYPNLEPEWISLGPLNPQPGSQDGKPKRRKFQGQARRARKTVSVKVPQDAQEDGAGILEDLIGQLEDRLGHEPHRPTYYSLVDGLNFALMWLRDNPVPSDDADTL